MERREQRRILEALVLAAGEPVAVKRLAEIVPGADAQRVRELVQELNEAYAREGHALEIHEVAGGFELRTPQALAGYVRALLRERPLRLSRAALETLAVVAYRQPISRAEVEQVRGVDSGPVLRSLLERGLVRIAGRREVPGRPLLYATTRRFLEVFGLRTLADLPTLREAADLLEASDGTGSAPASVAGESTREPPGSPSEGERAEPGASPA